MPSNKLYSDAYLAWFDKMGKKRPDHSEHYKEEDFEKLAVPAKCSNWRMEGNELVADTQYGELRQKIATNLICTGTDDNGMPILQKIGG